VSSAAIKSTAFKVAIALSEKSPKLPMGVATIYKDIFLIVPHPHYAL
jgi:hypothetical protein